MVQCNFSKAASCTTKACYFVRKKVFAVQAFFFFFDSVTVFTFYEKGGLKTFEPPSSINTLVLILCNCFYSIQASHTTKCIFTLKKIITMRRLKSQLHGAYFWCNFKTSLSRYLTTNKYEV